jgi:tRNA(Ile)-lysidine synthase
MTFSAASLDAVLQAHTPIAATGLVVAISGGMDSACLLTALAELKASDESAHSRGMAPVGNDCDEGAAEAPGISPVGEDTAEEGAEALGPSPSRNHAGEPVMVVLGSLPRRRLPVRAVHVDHGLQPAAAEFREFCVGLCRRLHIPLEVIPVVVDSSDGVSIEAAARDARYRGMAGQLRTGECLLTAHHALDQAETLLLQLLRGAGLKGMSAMPMCRTLGAGWHLRPLLDVAQRDLRQFAAATGIAAVCDPMNLDTRFDRAYLRTLLWPLIEERWPGAAIAVSRTARHVADAQELLDRSAALTVQTLRDGNALSVTGLRALPAIAQFNTLRYWIATSSARTLPSTARLTEALRQIMDADEDHLPAVIWGEHALRRYRERLFLTPAIPPCLGVEREWPVRPGAHLDLGEGLGRLRWSPQGGGFDAARLPPTLKVRRREGGETLKPNPRARTQSVQHLMQSLGVLPWMRDALPLVYAGEALIAVGDLWQDARWCVGAGSAGFGCVWEGAPILV